MIVALSVPPSITFTLDAFVSTIFSRSCTTGCTVVSNLVVLDTDVAVSIHFSVSSNDAFEFLKPKIVDSLYPMLYSVDDNVDTIEFVVVKLFPILSDNLVTVV